MPGSTRRTTDNTALSCLLVLCSVTLSAQDVRVVDFCALFQDLSILRSVDTKMIRITGTVELTMESIFLHDDRCTEPIYAGGQRWPRAIWLSFDKRVAKPPSENITKKPGGTTIHDVILEGWLTAASVEESTLSGSKQLYLSPPGLGNGRFPAKLFVTAMRPRPAPRRER